MIDIEIEGLEELERDWQAAVSKIGAGARKAVAAATRAGERVAEAHAPRRTGTLANRIEGKVTASDATSADGALVSRAPYSSFVADGTAAHEINARRAKALAFQSGGETVFRRSVHHPGTKPHDFMKLGIAATGLVVETSMTEIVDEACSKV